MTETFKSEYIQSVYEFLEKDADPSCFKQDLETISDCLKIPINSLEADFFQYRELIEQDLTNKITFIFRDSGYLGMFGEAEWISVEKTLENYKQLNTGDIVSVDMINKFELDYTKGTIWNDGKSVYMIQDSYRGGKSKYLGWEKFGLFSWWLCDYDESIETYGEVSVTRALQLDTQGHKNLKLYNKKYDTNINNLIVCDKEIKNMKNQMHFALVMELNNI